MSRKPKAVDPTIRAAQLRSELAALEGDAKKRHDAQLKQELGSVRAEIKDKQKKYGVLERRVFEAQAKLNNVESAMMHTLDASGRLHSIRPEIADFLPNDESVKSWKAECVALDKRMEELRSEKRAVGNVQLLRVEAVTLNDQINHLLWREQNILNELRRALAQRPVGGSFAPV